MIVKLGRRATGGDLVDLLLECHQRIREFSRLAVALASREGLDAPAILDAARRCERYFALALPLHVQDEELSLLPRLLARRPEAAAPLAAMRAQHEAHGPAIEALLGQLRAIAAQPGDPALRAALRPIAVGLEREFEQHLALEERAIFPAAREALTAEEQRVVLGELRARRGQG